MSMLRGSVAAGESGPLIVLSGEVDITNAAELSELVTGQLADGTVHLTVDVGRLDFADMAGIRVFLLAAKTPRRRAGAAAPATYAGQGAGSPRRRRGGHDPERNRGHTRARTISVPVACLVGESGPVPGGHSRATEGWRLTCDAPVGEAWLASSRAAGASAPRRACPAIGRHRAGPRAGSGPGPGSITICQRRLTGWTAVVTSSKVA